GNTPSKPLCTIGQGLIAAEATLGTSNVRPKVLVATKFSVGSTIAAYQENITLHRGISLYGGYVQASPSASHRFWMRDDNSPTWVYNVGNTHGIVVDYKNNSTQGTGTFYVDGFRLTSAAASGYDTDGKTGLSTYGAIVWGGYPSTMQDSGAQVVFRNTIL